MPAPALLLRLFNCFIFCNMAIGAIAISTSQKRDPPAPPFADTSARNGDSVDGTGVIVLGNDVGDPLAPATLLNDREIMAGFDPNIGQPFSVSVNDTIVQLAQTRLNGGTVQQIGTLGGTVTHTMEVTTLNPFPDRLDILIAGTADVQFSTGPLGTLVFMRADTGQGFLQIGIPQQTFNGAACQISGTMTHQAYLNGQTGAYNVDRDLDSGRVLFNSGASTYTLPNMTGANFRGGFTTRAAVFNAAGIVFQASAGQTIRFGAAASSVGGTLTSVTVGSTVRLVLINQTTWFTESFTGTWVPA